LFKDFSDKNLFPIRTFFCFKIFFFLLFFIISLPLFDTPYAKYFPESENFLVFRAAVPSSENLFGSKNTVGSSESVFYM